MKIIKNVLKKIILLYIKLLKNNVDINLNSNISINTLKCLTKESRKDYKVYIKDCDLGDIQVGYGCKLYKCECSSNVEIGRFVSIWGPGIKVSSRINKIKIGGFSSIASNVLIQEYYHRYDKISTYFMSNNIFDEGIECDIFSKGKINIEEDVWIGANSVILSGVTIGRGSIIGAGSVVTKDIPRYSIAVGNPAKVIKFRFTKDEQEYLENSKWWQWDIEKIVDNKDMFKYSINNENLLRLLNK